MPLWIIPVLTIRTLFTVRIDESVRRAVSYEPLAFRPISRSGPLFSYALSVSTSHGNGVLLYARVSPRVYHTVRTADYCTATPTPHTALDHTNTNSNYLSIVRARIVAVVIAVMKVAEDIPMYRAASSSDHASSIVKPSRIAMIFRSSRETW
jgi:hypothetical protein